MPKALGIYQCPLPMAASQDDACYGQLSKSQEAKMVALGRERLASHTVYGIQYFGSWSFKCAVF